MYDWSVLNNTITGYITSKAENKDMDIWEEFGIDFQINNVIRNMKAAKTIEDLYVYGKNHQRWDSPFVNKLFFSALNELRGKFGGSTIGMLMDVFAEAAYIAQDDHPRKESDYVIMIEQGFEDIFPEFEFIKREAQIDNYRLDILAKDKRSKKAVIFEVKMGRKDPTSQLLTYKKIFDKPLLIGITEKRLIEHQQHKDIYYFTYDDLNKRAVANIQNKYSNSKNRFTVYYSKQFDRDRQAM
ncbi:hypothetical protein NE619_10885 [Anaerovorax odorimutans]|uniref:PD-(D/E)XK nuclease superfamily protein n=1 Tax=Anaerovorax odorimutans TaxID=109327 RepID=A0ABT1RPW4_9FIRM|nr:hypothetical protein [Anaerovorax odorimutans]MCQ4637227.1 hypothetical protein [Anaerovorax odorimutans]